MKILESSWKLKCNSLAHKKQCFDYAQKCGVPTDSRSYSDEYLLITYGPIGNHVYSSQLHLESRDLITDTLFRALCEEYAGWPSPEPTPKDTPPLGCEYIHGLNLIHDEREHQVLIGRSTIERDDSYTEEQLHFFAQYWLTRPTDIGTRALIEADLCNKHGWRHSAFDYLMKSPEQRLAIAGALIAAELDRLHRLSQKK